ncbi:hypothetical protein [Sanguibacter suaedae]|uniref:Protein kinase domain-containing protein n=1 Tax=Sanguibacter suaedae TaxID=2795737 RepID=A0A934I991_9MICO|nr:hypothetical protein [Sanguibacter suaedae]MBI9114277.1 hypothetical protein [Sanguibacter suaedae]
MHALTDPQLEVLAAAGYVPADPCPLTGRARVRRPEARTGADRGGTDRDTGHGPVPGATHVVQIVRYDEEVTRQVLKDHLARWRDVDDPGLERLMDAVDLGDRAAVVTHPTDSHDLAHLVREEGPLTAGHTSTLLVVLGRTLARLHAAGLHYGPITTSAVLLGHGEPVLTVPLPAHDPRPIASSAVEDAYHLASLARSVMAETYGPSAPPGDLGPLRALARLVTSTLGDAQDRPGVGTLAARSHAVAPCRPLVIRGVADRTALAAGGSGHEPSGPATHARATQDDTGASGSPRPGLRALGDPPERRRRPPARLVVACAVGALVVGAGAALAARHDAPAVVAQDVTVDGAASDTPRDVTVSDAAEELTQARFDVLMEISAGTAAADAWDRVTVPGSPAHAQAVMLAEELIEGEVLSDLSTEVVSVEVLEEVDGHARVEVVYVLGGYTVESADGTRSVAAEPSREVVLDLVRTDQGWRVGSVTEPSA